MPFIELASSPLAPGASPVRVRYRECGAGAPLVFLHSGWGYEIYPFDRQSGWLASNCRIVMPDRSGYGGSTCIDVLPADFHARAAAETRAVIEALGLERPVLWGHSDGAIIALLLALSAPAVVAGVIAEATHFYRRKPGSRPFFESMAGNAQKLGENVASVLARDHGARWPQIVERHSRAWKAIAEDAASDTADFYDGRLGEIAVPVLIVHGARDPRTEPGEIDAMRQSLTGPAKAGRHACAILPDGGHSPHSEPETAGEVARIARAFLDAVGARPAPPDPPGPPAPPALQS